MDFETWWKLIEQAIPEAHAQVVREMAMHPPGPSDIARMKDKAALGWVEHRGGILNMSAEQVIIEEMNERDDLVVYRADSLMRGRIPITG